MRDYTLTTQEVQAARDHLSGLREKGMEGHIFQLQRRIMAEGETKRLLYRIMMDRWRRLKNRESGDVSE